MNSTTYDKFRCISIGKFSIQQFLRFKKLATNTLGINNSIFNIELNSLLTLYKSLTKEIEIWEFKIHWLIEKIHPHYQPFQESIPFQLLLFMLHKRYF